MTTAAAKRTSLVAALALGVVGAGVWQYRRCREEQRRAMTGGPKIAKVRKGMEVQTADEITLGRITDVWRGVDPLDGTTPAELDAIFATMETAALEDLMREQFPRERLLTCALEVHLQALGLPRGLGRVAILDRADLRGEAPRERAPCERVQPQIEPAGVFHGSRPI